MYKISENLRHLEFTEVIEHCNKVNNDQNNQGSIIQILNPVR